MIRICASLALSLALVGDTNAFSPNSVKPLASITRLQSHAIDSENEALYMMMKADACAHSDSCSVDDAEHYLQEILHLQSNCASGTLSSQQICEDVTFPAEVVAHLRAKLDAERSSGVRLNPLAVSLAAAYLVGGVYTVAHNPGVEMFTPQEWWWGVRDGYAGEMMSSMVKYGGLPAIDQLSVTPFTPQEVWWSVRDGYFGELFSQSLKNGGLVDVDTSLAMDDAVTVLKSVAMDDTVTVPFLPEEWTSAVKDGYLSDMISHYYKNGGL